MNKILKMCAVSAAALVICASCGMKYDKSAAFMQTENYSVTQNQYDYLYASILSNGYSEQVSEEETNNRCKVMIEVLELADKMDFQLTDKQEEDAKAVLEMMETQNYGSGSYKAFLKENSLSPNFFENLVYSNAYIGALMEQEGMSENITEEEIDAYYREHYRRANHILILVDETASDEEKQQKQAEADAIYQRVIAGEDFNTLVGELSEDPGKETNPEGYIFTDNQMVPEFQNAVDELEVGEIGMCTTDYGIHIIKRLALDETQEIYDTGLNSVRTTIQDGIANDRFKARLDEWCEEYGITVTENM